MLEKFVYHFLITTNPMPTAPRITRTPTGEAGAGVAVALGQGVGTFTVDFAVVFTIIICFSNNISGWYKIRIV